jgi:uncharacterized protein YcgL (UPF0745 family)
LSSEQHQVLRPTLKSYRSKASLSRQGFYLQLPDKNKEPTSSSNR